MSSSILVAKSSQLQLLASVTSDRPVWMVLTGASHLYFLQTIVLNVVKLSIITEFIVTSKDTLGKESDNDEFFVSTKKYVKAAPNNHYL